MTGDSEGMFRRLGCLARDKSLPADTCSPFQPQGAAKRKDKTSEDVCERGKTALGPVHGFPEPESR